MLIGLAVIGGAGAYYAFRKSAVATEVVTVEVTKGDIVEAVGASGTLEAVTTVQVGTQVSGTVLALSADFNSIVRKGQVIARLDPSLIETQIEQSRANLIRAEADVERLRVQADDAANKLARARGLSERNLIPRTELEAAEVAVRAAQAQIKSAEAQVTQARASLNQNQVSLQHTVITAPISGIVIARNVDVGQTVAASFNAPTLFLLAADLTKMKVSANIDESDVGKIRPGQKVVFRVDAYPADDFTGTVSQVRLQPVVTQNVVTYATVIDVPNPRLRLKPGMTANVTIEIARRNGVVRIPNTALRFRPTAETFAMLGLPAPDDLQRGSSRPGGLSAPENGTGGAPEATSTARSVTPPGKTQGRLDPGQPGGAGPGELDPERRQRFTERMQNMSPEERERFRQRREQQRGGTAGETGAQGPARQPSGAPTGPGAQTIDALFGPLPPTVSTGRVWVYVNNQLKPARIRLGITDGTHSELLGGDLQPGLMLVTGVTQGDVPPAGRGGPQTGNPLMPQRRGFRGPSH